MRREIKFRAFSKKSKGMILVEYATFLKDDSLVIYDDYKLMQYTGLKDKNGVDIYEGDIVILQDDISTAYKYSVEYGDDGAYWLKSPNRDSHIYRFLNDIIVIGNLYENLELLETI